MTARSIEGPPLRGLDRGRVGHRSPRLPDGYSGSGDPLQKPLADPLWTPILSHFRKDGHVDIDRMSAQLKAVRPNLRQLMLAGSTGDGWELGDDAFEQVIQLAWRDELFSPERPLLFGVLRPTTEEVIDRLGAIHRVMRSHSGREPPILAAAVCPPVDRNANQKRILSHFERIVGRSSLPIAVYQLPQVTGCAISPATMRELSKWDRIVMFKDSSGGDAVVRAGGLDPDLVLLRGAEGGYADAVAPSGGYDGWLLSTGNSFPAALRTLASHIGSGDADAARRLSALLTAASAQLFASASSVKSGNAFSNANRAADHVLAWGARWDAVESPRTISGEALPREMLATAAEILKRLGEYHDAGYLEVAPKA